MKYKISGAGPALVFVPGLDGTGTLFYRQERELAKHFTVITCSLRDSGNFTYKDLLEDLENLILKLDKGRVTLCGESFGGTILLQFALAYPKLLKNLVIINSFPYFRNRTLFITGRLLLEFTPYEFLQLSRVAAVRLGLLAEDLEEKEKEEFISITTKIPKLAVVRRMDLIRGFDFRDKLNQIKTETLFIAGREDRLQNSVLEAEFMASQMPCAKIKVLENMGHIPLPSQKCSLLEIFNEMDFLPR
ncbi:MAG: alpha/beta hydrolase [Acidobacteria bacterium]|nr:alpha/beta hydrolase [Acidobacteriota bacterium]